MLFDESSIAKSDHIIHWPWIWAGLVPYLALAIYLELPMWAVSLGSGSLAVAISESLEYFRVKSQKKTPSN